MIDRIRWIWLEGKCCTRLNEVLARWIKTPYHAGQRARGIGVDCVQLGPAIFDELYQVTTPTIVPRLVGDIALHNVRGSWPTLKALKNGWHGFTIVRDNTIQPGDWISTRAEDGAEAPGRQAHLMIASGTPWKAIHAIPRVGVRWTTFERTRGILRIYRPNRKDLWA